MKYYLLYSDTLYRVHNKIEGFFSRDWWESQLTESYLQFRGHEISARCARYTFPEAFPLNKKSPKPIS